MAAWSLVRQEFLELRDEDASADERAVFEEMFRWNGLNDAAVARGLEAADRLRLQRGGARPNHARSGAPGERRRRLTREHLSRFKELTGDLVVRLGDEDDPDR